MKIFSGSTNKPLAEKIAKDLHISLSPLEIHVFPDGEKRIRIEEDVVDGHVIIVQSMGHHVDQSYMELFFILDALKRSGASQITAVIPYLGYQRQDHVFRSGEAVSIQVIIKILESLKVDRVIVFDLHAIRIKELFSIPVSHLSALPIFAQKIEEIGWKRNDVVLVSPDLGGLNRLLRISKMLGGMKTAALVKNRDLASGNIEISEVQGELQKKVIIIDDMISSGKTITEGAKLLKQKGVEEIIVFVTHPVFSKEAPQILQESPVEKVFVTDTIQVQPHERFEKLEILSVAHLIAEDIKSSLI